MKFINAIVFPPSDIQFHENQVSVVCLCKLMFINQLHLPKSCYFQRILSSENQQIDFSAKRQTMQHENIFFLKTSIEQMFEITHLLFLYIWWHNKKRSWLFLEKEISLPRSVLVHLQIYKCRNCFQPMKLFPPECDLIAYSSKSLLMNSVYTSQQ